MRAPSDTLGPDSIRLDGVTVRFRLPIEPVNTFKEHLVRWARGHGGWTEFSALTEIDLSIRSGETFGIVGHNGAGKTTLLRIIARELRPSSGRVRVRGRVSPLVGLSSRFHPELTGRENILLTGTLLGIRRATLNERLDGIIQFADLGAFIDCPVRTYSTGMTARLGFSIASDLMPDILIIDEGLGVGDATFQDRAKARMSELRGTGATILLVSHDLKMIERLCHRVAVLDHGRVIAVDDPARALAKYQERVAAAC